MFFCLLTEGTVAADCDFPPDHPVSASAPVLVVNQHRVYVYNDTFDYSGDIRALTFCYTPGGSAASETLFTVEIRKPGNGNGGVEESHDVIVNPVSDLSERTNCISGLLDWPHCCIEQTLAESIRVNPSRWYALRVSGPASLLLRHLTAHANGEQTDLNGSPIPGTLYKSLFFFSIDSSDGNKNCMI